MLTYHDEMPSIEKKVYYSKYALTIRKFLLVKKPVASTKAATEKQEATLASSFRRAVKEYDYHIKVIKHGKEVFLIKLDMEGGKDK